jgi:hypothetical protein
MVKYFIQGEYENLNKSIFKKFFILCGKTKRVDLGSHIYGIYINNMSEKLGYKTKIGDISIYYSTFLIFSNEIGLALNTL